MLLIVFVINVLISAWCDADTPKENNLYEDFYKTSGSYFVSREAVNWTDAKQACKNVGLELASVISEDEQNALGFFIIENELVPKDKWSGYWLSGTRHEDGNYYWDSTGTEVGATFRGWAWGEPSHAYGREDCVELKLDNNFLRWNDYFCDETRRYICEVPRKLKTKDAKKKIKKQSATKEWYKSVDYYDVVQPVDTKENDDLENLDNSESATWYPPAGFITIDGVLIDLNDMSEDGVDYTTQLSSTE